MFGPEVVRGFRGLGWGFLALLAGSLVYQASVTALLSWLASGQSGGLVVLGLVLLTGVGGLTSFGQAAFVGIGAYTSAYLTEIWRGCVASIPKGQWEAAQSLALNFAEQLRHVVLPQALRIAVPPTVGFLVQVIKGTALASVIGFVELTKAGSMISNATYQPFLVYACVALLYFALCFPVSLVAQSLERKLHANRR